MRTLRKNQQRMYYSLLIGDLPIYETNDDGTMKYYEDSEGNRYPLETGEKKLVYTSPEVFYGNISMSGGEAEAVEYGLSTESYEAVIVTQKNAVPMIEGALIWHTSPVEYEYGGVDTEIEFNGEIIKTTFPKAVSSDYMVIKHSPSLNVDKYILRATNK